MDMAVTLVVVVVVVVVVVAAALLSSSMSVAARYADGSSCYVGDRRLHSRVTFVEPTMCSTYHGEYWCSGTQW